MLERKEPNATPTETSDTMVGERDLWGQSLLVMLLRKPAAGMFLTSRATGADCWHTNWQWREDLRIHASPTLPTLWRQ